MTRCTGNLIVSGAAEESADWAFRVVAECDGGPAGDCGFREPLPEWDGDPVWFITSEEMADIQVRHLAHSGRS